ncbi:MAG: hypothetical protein ACC682_01670 [Gemmatimonadota bacterium]
MKTMSRFVSSLLCAGLLGFASAAIQPAVAQDLDLTGEWVFTVQSPNGSGTRQVTFFQEGEVLTGTIASSQAEGDLEGVLDGDQASFTVVITMSSGVFAIVYDATVTGDEMEGTVDFGDYGQGTFTGKRADPKRGT